ncbi:AraC family transcriptional regulator [Aureimonas flava]|uniref:AraC family transcriptional regulator n=1 Tax=Aureimonas flava TaxID=2320271 RepID=A0A3A1WN46_9HYPH|nr:AraC family transcriptional regulator [Aureimonas flava]RIY03317.1 AraC family transcriptional regulator [Aureimonas flava]
MTIGRPDTATPAAGSDPALEIILRGPGESFRWAKHDYPHHLAKWHRHPEYELHLVTSGRGRMMIGDYVGPFQEGCLVLAGPNLPHNWISDLEPGASLPNRDMLVQFDAAVTDTLVGGFAEFADLRCLLRDAAFGVEFTGATAERARMKLCAMEHERGAGRLVSFLSLLADLAARPEERRVLARCAPSLGLHTSASRRLDRVIAFITERYASDISLSDAATVCNMEVTAFSRFFKHQTGHNFTSYVNRLRVQQACALLAGSEMPVTRICYEVGYNNTANFNRQFHAVCQQTPSAYRDESRRIRAHRLDQTRAA